MNDSVKERIAEAYAYVYALGQRRIAREAREAQGEQPPAEGEQEDATHEEHAAKAA